MKKKQIIEILEEVAPLLGADAKKTIAQKVAWMAQADLHARDSEIAMLKVRLATALQVRNRALEVRK